MKSRPSSVLFVVARVLLLCLSGGSLGAAALCASAAATSPPAATAMLPARGSIDVGSTGADGAFEPLTSVQIDLGVQGTYDPVHWRVVFNYSSVHIPAGVAVTFKNHPSRAPVVWLSQTDILIEGGVSVDGQGGLVYVSQYPEPGPGGFRGGMYEGPNPEWLSSSGFGPGGAYQNQSTSSTASSGGGYGSAGQSFGGGVGGYAYGDPTITQLIGGSGGAAGRPGPSGYGWGGGAGGGALLLAANDSIHVSGSGGIYARGGAGGADYNNYRGGGGAGGAIRLLADQIIVEAGGYVGATGGPGVVNNSGNGSNGRIRFEANQFTIDQQATPPASTGGPGVVIPPAGSPTLRVLEVGGVAAPADPIASIGDGPVTPDIAVATGVMTTVVVETTNVPLNSIVYLRVAGATGPAWQYLVTDGVTNPLTVTGGPELQARTSLTLDLSAGYSALQARVVFVGP